MNQKTPSPYPDSSNAPGSLMRAALRFAGIGLYRYRLDGTLIDADDGTLRILDLSDEYPDPAMLKGRNISELLVYKQPRGYLREQLLQHRHLRDFQYPFRTLKGADKWALHDSYIDRDPETGEEYVQVVVRDITPIKQAEEALAAEKERLTVTLRSIGDGVIATDANGAVVLLNKIAEQMTGWTQAEALGLPLENVFHIVNEQTRQPVDSPVTRVLKEGVIVGLANHTALVKRDGTECSIADSGAPIFDGESRMIGVVLVFRDVTELRRLQMESERAVRVEALGQLAGGIAHDFNNILMGILGNISLARVRLPESADAQLAGLLQQAEQACDQARALTQQLLTFARGGAPVCKTVSLPELLRETVEFTLHGAPVRAEFGVPPDLWHVEADPGQLAQVIGNLVLNARQAMPEGGAIEIRAANVPPGANAAVPDSLKSYVRVSVCDHGIGIAPRHLPHIFDPYFSTKQSGTGLGLAITHSIIARHNGGITVRSNLGKGTTFDLFLPASKTPLPAVAEPGVAPCAGHGRVLVMDDEAYVLDTLSKMLAILGYEPVQTRNSDEAVAAYTRALAEKRPVRAVILDLTIRGGAGGLKTLERLREADPAVVAIVSSGYSSDPVMAHPAQYGFRDVLPKPYRLEDVARVLARLLAQ